MCNLAWHYTTGQKFSLIVECGELRTTAIHIAHGEQPAIWCSSNQKWEPTANKLLRNADGTVVRLDQAQTREMGGGLIRFGIKRQKLLPWFALLKAARIPKATVRSLEQAGIKQGANPLDWWGSLKPVSLDVCEAIEVMNQNGEWERVFENGKPSKDVRGEG